MDSIKSFRGKSEQIPPAALALKIDGKDPRKIIPKKEKLKFLNLIY